MPWFKIETELIRHDKVLAIPEAERAACVGLYVGILGYCAELLTDGRIPRSVVLGIGQELGLKRPLRYVETLEKVSLLEHKARHFYEVYDYLGHQKSRQQVLDDRAAAAARKRRSRGQTTLDVTPDVTAGQKGGRHTVTAPVTRAHMRAGAEGEGEGEKEPKAEGGSPPGDQRAEEPPAFTNLDPALELEVARLVAEVTNKDNGSETVLRSFASRLPLGAVVKVRESSTGKPAAYAVSALKDECRERGIGAETRRKTT